MMGLPPVGCAPHFLWEYGSQDGECIDYINNVVIQFNYALRYMSSEFIRQHPGSMISYCDTFEGSVDILKNRDRYGEQMYHCYYCQIAFLSLGKNSHYDGITLCRFSDHHWCLLWAGEVWGPVHVCSSTDGVQRRIEPCLVGRVPPHGCCEPNPGW